MHIQKRNNAFYLKASIWDKDTKKTVTNSTYLGSDAQTALEKLQSEVPEYEFTKLKADLLEKDKIVTNQQKAKPLDQPIMRMSCGRVQMWGVGADELPVEGQDAWCVHCQKFEKIIKVIPN